MLGCRHLLVVVRDIFVFVFNDTATTEIYTLPLHDALPISGSATGSAVCSTGSVLPPTSSATGSTVSLTGPVAGSTPPVAGATASSTGWAVSSTAPTTGSSEIGRAHV